MTFSELLYEPGFWFLLPLVFLALAYFAISLVLRAKIHALLEVADSVIKDPECHQEDRAWVAAFVGEAASKELRFIAILAPALVFMAGWTGARQLVRVREKNEGIEALKDQSQARLVKIRTGVDPLSGALWNDSRRRVLVALSNRVEMLSQPIASLWIMTWLVVAIPFTLAFAVCMLGVGGWLSIRGWAIDPFVQFQANSELHMHRTLRKVLGRREYV